MSKVLQTYEKEQIQKLTSKKRIPTFRPGDTLKVTVRITEGSKTRLQAFEGVCIARKNSSINSNFTVRKISHGEGVERVFPLLSPIVEKIDVIRKGDVRRAKLYYLRELSGKKARIADRDRGDEPDQYEFTEITQQKKIDPNDLDNVSLEKSADKSKAEQELTDESKDAENHKAEDKSDEEK